jgi:DNA polymerase I
MELLPGLEKEIKKHPKKGKVETFSLPKDPDFYAKTINYVYKPSGARNMVELAFQRPLSHIGIEFLCHNNSPDKGKRHNPRDIQPLVLSLAMAEPGKPGKKGVFYRFVVDLRKPKVIPILREIFSLPVCFLGHNLKNTLFSLWKLQLEPPRQLWDSFICEEALELGLYHWKYHARKDMDLPQEIQAKKELKEHRAVNHSLERICQRHGIPCGGNRSKALIKRLEKQSKWKPLEEGDLKTAAERATLAGKLYFFQVQKAEINGILSHLLTIEMPYVKTNAAIEWEGVRIDEKRRVLNRKHCKKLLKKLEKALAEYDISVPPKDQDLKNLFKKAGILDKFKIDGKISFEKAILKENKGAHPAIPVILSLNRLNSVLNSKILKGKHSNNRLYPQYNQLGTDTGRLTSKNPNIMGLNRVLRPLIIPRDGRLIGEADWSQVEIGILAALYRDKALIDMFNTGDVYSEMAKVFYKNEIDPADLRLSGRKFKKKYPKQRQTMKTCILAVIYGMTPKSLAKSLECSVTEARHLHQNVIAMISKFESIKAIVQWSGVRGYASTLTNLHRNRKNTGKATDWEKRWLLNYPIQGTGAAIFKATANRLVPLYRPLDAKIIIPLHDSFVFEAPKCNFKKVTRLTKKIMKDTFQEFFPVLKPRVEINANAPLCWNRGGEVDLLNRWVKKQRELLNE